MVARDSSVVGGNTVLLFFMPSQVGGWGGRNLLVAKAEAKREVAANSQEVK